MEKVLELGRDDLGEPLSFSVLPRCLWVSPCCSQPFAPLDLSVSKSYQGPPTPRKRSENRARGHKQERVHMTVCTCVVKCEDVQQEDSPHRGDRWHPDTRFATGHNKAQCVRWDEIHTRSHSHSRSFSSVLRVTSSSQTPLTHSRLASSAWPEVLPPHPRPAAPRPRLGQLRKQRPRRPLAASWDSSGQASLTHAHMALQDAVPAAAAPSAGHSL